MDIFQVHVLLSIPFVGRTWWYTRIGIALFVGGVATRDGLLIELDPPLSAGGF